MLAAHIRPWGGVGVRHVRASSREFCELLALLDEQTPVGQPIHLILDPVSSHWSAEGVTG